MDNDERVIIKDEFGNDVEVKLLNIIEIDGREYLVYYAEKYSDENNIYAMRIVKNDLGEEDLLPIEDEDEKKVISDIISSLTEEKN